MWNRRLAVSGLVIAAAGLVGACTDTSPTEARPDLAGPSFDTHAAAGQQSHPGIDAVYAEMARQLPGFGGVYHDATGTMHVYMTRSESGVLPTAAEVRAKLRPMMRAHGMARGGMNQLVVDEGQHDFLELHGWSERALPVLGMDGVVFTDIDEAHNRLRIGIQSDASVGEIEAALDRLGVPREAVHLEITEPIVPLATLRDRVRPVAGGLQLIWPHPLPNFVFLCTLGFSVQRPDTHHGLGFITNSHCTFHRGSVNETPYYQQPVALPNPANLIGIEVLDPPFFTSPCFVGYVCRWSDAAMARYTIPEHEVAFGQIYRTLFAGTTTPGSLEIDPHLPRFFITDEAPFSMMGQTMNKMGRTTGWTRGPVVGTCVNVGVAGSAPPIAMLCQDLVQAAVAGGDSGSPVFEQIGHTNHVRLYGILWGGGTNLFVFSPMENIQFELGPFRTF